MVTSSAVIESVFSLNVITLRVTTLLRIKFPLSIIEYLIYEELSIW